jgi:nitrate reductase beta subunit
LLYDADRIEDAAKRPDEDLVAAQREMVLDPFDPEVVERARKNGLPDSVIESARKSPVFRFVKEFELALPLHPEFRTMPMLFYVPPLLPVAGFGKGGIYRLSGDFFSSLESSRVPIRYMADLFSGGNESVVTDVLKKLIAARVFKRAQTVGDISPEETERALAEGRTSPEEVEEIYRLTSLSTFDDRFVIPPFLREQAVESFKDPFTHSTEAGFNVRRESKRRW